MHSSSPLPSFCTPDRVLLLSGKEAGGRMDAACLRHLQVGPVERFTRADDVWETLCAVQTDHAGALLLLVCDLDAGQARVRRLLRRMAETAACARLPVLLLAGQNQAAARFSGCGPTVLERPYTSQALRAALVSVLSPRRSPLCGRALGPVRSAERADKGRTRSREPRTAGEWMQAGLSLLRSRETDQAIRAFHEVLRRREDHAEACLALARILRGRNQEHQADLYLIRAAAGYARAGNDRRSQALMEKLPGPVVRPGNVFACEALALLKQEHYQAAARSFLDASERSGEPLAVLISRASLFTDAPELMVRRLCRAYEDMDRGATAARLRMLLLSPPPPPPAPVRGWLSRYPLLHDALCVAGYTARVWRQA